MTKNSELNMLGGEPPGAVEYAFGEPGPVVEVYIGEPDEVIDSAFSAPEGERLDVAFSHEPLV